MFICPFPLCQMEGPPLPDYDWAPGYKLMIFEKKDPSLRVIFNNCRQLICDTSFRQSYIVVNQFPCVSLIILEGYHYGYKRQKNTGVREDISGSVFISYNLLTMLSRVLKKPSIVRISKITLREKLDLPPRPLVRLNHRPTPVNVPQVACQSDPF